jgi:glucose-6-phosphate isomerase
MIMICRPLKLSPASPAGITGALTFKVQGTRNTLHENGRESVTITVEKLDAQSIGVPIALYERAVGFYATFVNVNAYHQPGVEAGKKMAGAVIQLQADVLGYLRKNAGKSFTVEEIAKGIAQEEGVESIFTILEHASANNDRKVKKNEGKNVFAARFEIATSE